MIVRSGNAASFLVEFPSGPPDGNVSWRLLGEAGDEITGGSLPVPSGSVSVTLTIPGINNTILTLGVLTAYRDLEWDYTVDGVVVNGEQRYSIEARVPYGVTPEGVRSKLGVNDHEIPDGEIRLVEAYLSFTSLVNPLLLAAATDHIALRNAIEAMAALALVPSLPVRLALKEASGTDSFQRDKLNLAELYVALQGNIADGLLAVDPNYDPMFGFGDLFILAPPGTDAFTGAEGSR